jgi:hypothetical protein
VVFYSSCQGVTLEDGLDIDLGFALRVDNPEDNAIEYEADGGIDVGVEVSVGYAFDYSDPLDPELTVASGTVGVGLSVSPVLVSFAVAKCQTKIIVDGLTVW